MIVAWTGTPGSGKSYSAVYLVGKHLEAGKLVVTNIPLQDDWALELARTNALRRCIPGRVRKTAADYERRLLRIDSLRELMHVRLRGDEEGRGVAVLDEAHRWLNPRTWDADETGQTLKRTDAIARRLEIVQWFADHRHLGFDVILITQSLATIDAQVERLVEYLVTMRNLKRYRLGPVAPFGWLPWPVFRALWHEHNTPGNPFHKREWFRLRKRIARAYKTHGLALERDDDPFAQCLPRPDPLEAGRGRAEPAAAAPVELPAEPTADVASAAPRAPAAAVDGLRSPILPPMTVAARRAASRGSDGGAPSNGSRSPR